MFDTIKKYWVGLLLGVVVLAYCGHLVFNDSSYSSFIQNAHYSPINRYLGIKIRDKNYGYCNIPIKIWAQYKQASSKGSFYNSMIKGRFTCSDLKDSDMVFDHTIPLGLGGKDFGSESFADFTNEDYGVPVEVSAKCFAELVQNERDMLKDSGYHRLPDGSWVDINNEYPNFELENNIEIQLSKEFFSCIR